MLASSLNRFAVRRFQAVQPHGVPRLTLCRIAATSSSVKAVFTHFFHPGGRVTGPPCSHSPREGKLDHRQSSARVTRRARTGFRSI